MLLLKPFNQWYHGRPMVHPWKDSHLSLSLRGRVSITRTLAHMLHSLVRVSRRVDYKHFASILEASFNKKTPCGMLRMIHHPSLSTSCRPRESITALRRDTYLVSLFLAELESHADLPSLNKFRKCNPLLIIASLLTISGPFYSLFKVLFIFRSLYLFAIGFSPLFSFRRNLPPD